jgi:winged helix DNA-binding protein
MFLSRRALNRATLERQLLLRRHARAPLDVVAALGGLQGQEPNAPYIGLWTRLATFDKAELTALLESRQVVRSSVLRATQHLVTADDFRWIRPLVQPLIERTRQTGFGRQTAGLDLAAVAVATRELLHDRTLTRSELGRLLAERFPGYDPVPLGWSAQCLVPMIHPPPNGTWNRGGPTPFAVADEWVGPPAEKPVTELIRRYLAAFGPATVKDVQTWSGLTRLRGVLEELRPQLRTFCDEDGTELFDLPDAPLPDPDAPAPVRFLPAYDNLLVGHADRTRVISDRHRRRVITGSLVRPTFLVDGFVRGAWAMRTDKPGGTTTLTIQQYEELADQDRAALAEEGGRLLAFCAPENDHQIVFLTGEAAEVLSSRLL